MNASELTVSDNRERNRFEIDLGDGEVAFAEYRLHPEVIDFVHTVVPPSHGGQGIGTRLIEAALSWARKHGLKVAPYCPFFARYMKEHEEAQDLLADGWRKRLELD